MIMGQKTIVVLLMAVTLSMLSCRNRSNRSVVQSSSSFSGSLTSIENINSRINNTFFEQIFYAFDLRQYQRERNDESASMAKRLISSLPSSENVDGNVNPTNASPHPLNVTVLEEFFTAFSQSIFKAVEKDQDFISGNENYKVSDEFKEICQRLFKNQDEFKDNIEELMDHVLQSYDAEWLEMVHGQIKNIPNEDQKEIFTVALSTLMMHPQFVVR